MPRSAKSHTADIDAMAAELSRENTPESPVVQELRRGARLADQHDDPGTVDLFSRIVQIHEKHEWWLRDILRTGDGLCA